MTQPALLGALSADPERSPQRTAVYVACLALLDHDEPREAKLDVVGRMAKVSRMTAFRSLGWLILRGYVVLHRRGHRGVAVLTLARTREPKARSA